MRIVKIVRRGEKNVRVMLESGQTFLVSLEEAIVGNDINMKLERKIDSKLELENIKKELDAYLGHTKHGIPSYMTKEDLVQEIFLSFWEKNYWSMYDPKFGLAWTSFIYTGVKNFITSLTNSASNREGFKAISMNRKKTYDSEDEVGDFIKSPGDLQEEVLNKIILDQINDRISGMAPTGLPGLTYLKLYKELMSGKKQSQISREMGWSETTLSLRKKELQAVIEDELSKTI